MIRLACALVFSLAVLVPGAAPAQEKSVVLFDFEQGIEGWWGNPWGGGKCRAQKADSAKYGAGALHGLYEEVNKGANVVSPILPQDAPWRSQTWNAISFWLKGDGSHGKLSLRLETDQPGSTGFSAPIPLETTDWTRFEFDLSRFWSREGLTPRLCDLKRVMFSGKATHFFQVDHIALHAPHRGLPLDLEKLAVCRPCVKAPVLDGALDDECWKNATVIAPFVTNDFGKMAKDQTEVMVCWDAERLYLGARMKMADPAKLKAALTRRDADVYTEDCIEFFFDPDDAQKSWFQLDANPLGTLMDIASSGGKAWDADWQAKCSIGKDGWTAEAAIRFSSFGRNPRAGDVWGFNVGREVPATGEISCWSCTGGKFHNLSRWGHLVFAGDYAPQPTGYEFNEYAFGDYGVICDAAALADKGGEARLRLTSAQGEVFENKIAITPQAARSGEIFIPVSAAFKEQGEAKFAFTIVSGDSLIAARTGRFVVFPPPKSRPKPFISILPSPKQIAPTAGQFVLPAEATLACTGLPPEDRRRCTAALAAELGKYYGTKIREESAEANISLICSNAGALPEEGYRLEITPAQVRISAGDPRGIFAGIQTFLQVLAQTTQVVSEPKAPAMTVQDHPSLRIRAATMSIPCNRWGHPNNAYVSPEFFCDFLARTLIRWKYNTLVLIVGNGMKFDSHPECSGPAAWSKDEVRRVLDFCRQNYLDVVPLQTVLGHANWFTLAHKDLWEDGDYHIACVSNPATQKLLHGVYDEIIDVFKPKFMHLGMDEAWWKTLDAPAEKRCKLCAGKPKWQIVADQAAHFRDYLAARGIRAMMWGDMLLEEHNGGAPYHSAKALDAIPRDIVICNWSTSLAPASSKRFRDAGHEVIQSNSVGVNRQQADWIVGNMMGIWVKNPWLTDSYFRGAQGYSFLSLVNASEYSWNVSDDVSDSMKKIQHELIRGFADSALRQLALRPEAPSDRQRPVVITPVCNITRSGGAPPARERWLGHEPQQDLHALPEKLSAGGMSFELLPATGPPNAVAAFEHPVVIPVNARVASLYFLQGCDLPETDREAFLKRFHKKEAMAGVLIGAFRIQFQDGTTDTMDIRYGWNVLPWRMRENILPYCYGSAGVFTFATDAMKHRDPRGVDVQLYATQWANPRPDIAIAAVEFSSAGTEATPFILAVSAKPAK